MAADGKAESGAPVSRRLRMAKISGKYPPNAPVLTICPFIVTTKWHIWRQRASISIHRS
jgi:hypothetical protein